MTITPTKPFKSERHLALSDAFPSEDENRHQRHRIEYDTTRRYARSLAEAFPDERAAALHIPRPRSPIFTRSVGVVLGLVVVSLVAAAVMAGR